MSYKPWVPHNSLPPLPPKRELETLPVLKKLTEAARAVGELKGMGRVIPNQSMLVNTVVLQEAKASSEIENVVTTNDKLYRALTASTGNVDPATKEVLRYREALWQGFNDLKSGRRIDETLEVAAAKLPPSTYSKELVELLFHQPYTKGQILVDAGIAKRQTAAEYLKQLVEIGVLAPMKVGRENLYLNRKLYDLLAS